MKPLRCILSFVVIAGLLGCCDFAEAQIFRQKVVTQTTQRVTVQSPCEGGFCPAPVIAAPQVQTPVVDTPEESAAVVATTPHVRCIYNGSCGSGTICGHDERGSYVLTNAHVVGTSIGRVATIDCVTSVGTKRTKGRIVMSGYSDRTMVDFAILFCENLTSDRYMPLLKTQPTDAPYSTTGSPKCVWPQVLKPFNDPTSYGQGLITGTPNAIGGQSGSAIYNSKGRQIALLTWSISGRCAGQKTAKLWEVAQTRNVEVADKRPAELQELADNDGCRPETQVGVFGDMAQLEPIAELNSRPETEQGFFDGSQLVEVSEGSLTPVERREKLGPLTSGVQNIVGSAMADLPIWYEPGNVDPPADPEEPSDPDCIKLTPKEKELIDFLRNQAQESGLRDGAKEKDWLALIIKLMPLILEIIKSIQDGQV